MTKYSTKTLMLIPLIAIAMIVGTASQVMAIEGNDEASIKVRSIEFKNHGVYDVHLQISSGNEDLAAGKILVTSDVSSKEVNYFAVPSESTTDVRTMIKLNDRSSVDAKFINIDDKPTAKLVKIVSITKGGVDLHRATVMVKTGSEAIRNVKLLLESDMESLFVFTDPARNTSDVNRIFNPYSQGLTTTNIHAMDSESISVKLASYDNLR